MKKLLFVLLASASISPAMAQTYYVPVQRTSQPVVQTQTVQGQATQKQVRRVVKAPVKYKLGNPLYRPAAQTGVIGGEIRYTVVPKTSVHAKSDGWDIVPDVAFGLTDKLSVKGSAGYGRSEIKSGAMKGNKTFSYQAEVGLRYLIASADNFDFNVNADFYYMRTRTKTGGDHQNNHLSGTNIGLQVGKKIENITPYFGIGFRSNLWSKQGNAPAGNNDTNVVINPGIYIDVNEQVGLDLSYSSIVHQIATYRGVVDFYPQENVVLGFGAFMAHPETDLDGYGVLANVKFKF